MNPVETAQAVSGSTTNPTPTSTPNSTKERTEMNPGMMKRTSKFQSLIACPFSFLSILFLVGVAFFAASPIDAQSLVFTGSQVVLPPAGLSQPSYIGTDGAGNVYVLDSVIGEFNINFVEFQNTAAGYIPTTFLVDPGLPYFFGMAVDTAGDVFAITENGSIVERPPSGAAVILSPCCFPSAPSYLAVDPAGNLYISMATGTYQLLELTKASGYHTLVQVGAEAPYNQVAFDSAGDLFYASTPLGSSEIEEAAAAPGGFGAPASIANYAPFYLQPGFGNIGTGMAVDGQGNVFAADPTNNRVLEVPHTSSGYGPIATAGYDLNSPLSVAVDPSGNLFVTDTGNNRVVEVPSGPPANDFGSVNVCAPGQTTPNPCFQTQTLNYDVHANVTLGTIKVVTGGQTILDFSLASSGTCTGAVTAPGQCSIQVTFAPVFGGPRSGVVQIFDNTGNLLVSTPIYGIGVAPEVALQSSLFAPLSQGINLSSAFGASVDQAGNVFVADRVGQQVVAFPVNGAATIVVNTGAIALTGPTGVAVDGAGDVFIADPSGLIEVPASGSPATVPVSGLNTPYGLAFDAQGDLFIADSTGDQVLELPQNGAAPFAVGTGLSNPTGVAVDFSGDLYIADSGNNRVLEVSAGTQTTVGTGFSGPAAVAVDAANDVYIADTGNQRVVEVQEGTGTQTTIPFSAYAGPISPYGVAVDGTGNLYFTSYIPAPGSYPGQLLMGQYSQTPGVGYYSSQSSFYSLATTNVGSTSSDSPVTVLVQDVGNSPLSFFSPPPYSAVSIQGPADPSFFIVAGPGTPPDCTTIMTTGLAPAATCEVNVDFAPAATGLQSANLVIYTDALRQSAGNTSSVALNGTGQATAKPPVAQVTPNPLNFPIIQYGMSENLTLTIANAGGGDLFLTSVPVPSNSSYQVLNSCPTAITPSSPCLLTVEFDPLAAIPEIGKMTVSTNGGNVVVTLNGTATAKPPLLQVTPKPMNFIAIPYGQSEKLTLTIANIGGGTLTLNSTPVPNGPSYKVLGTCPAAIEVGNPCELQIEFDPVTVGQHNDTFPVFSNGGNVVVNLHGTAIGVGTILEEPLNFGTIPLGTHKILQLTVYDFLVHGFPTVTFSVNGPSYKVLPGGSCFSHGLAYNGTCTAKVEFDPAVVGTHNDVLTVTPSVGQPSTVNLTGIASGIGVEIETPLNFGTIPFGTAKTLPLTVYNVGVPGSPKVKFSVNGPSYKVLPGSQCATTGVAAGRSCTVQVEFDPVSMGVHNDILTLTPGGGAAASNVDLNGTAN